MNKKVLLSIILSLLLIFACNTQSSQQPIPTPIFIPVIVTVGIPVPVTVTAAAEAPAAQLVPSDNLPVLQIEHMENLEEDSQLWSVYEEGSPTWTLQNVDSPSQNGKSLQCSITGGGSYSNAHCYINLDAIEGANSFKLSLNFQFLPLTTCNNQEIPSVVQAIEFTMNKWESSKRYEFAVQWQNVGDGAPQWRYWDPSRADTEQWVPINANASFCLSGEQWHTLALDGDLVDDQVHYKSFTIDNFTYNLDITVAPAPAESGEELLAVAVQVDGNEQQTPYDLFIDNVNFMVQKNVDCGSIDSANEGEFDFPYIELSPETQITLDGTTQNELSPNGQVSVLVVSKTTKVTWQPGCLMDLQFYQDGDVIVDEFDASSGDYSFDAQTLNGGEVPTGINTQVKIWRAGEVIKDIWVRVKE